MQKNILLKVAARALLVAMQKIPVVGGIIEIGRECWQALRDEQEKAAENERVVQLEQAAAITPEEARKIAQEVIAEVQREGHNIDTARAESVQDIISVMPAQIHERTRATLNHARRLGTQAVAALPVTNQFKSADREAFYTSLFPQRRPRFRSGDALIHGTSGWKLEHLLGAGGFGEVWLVKRQAVDELEFWAVKFCYDELSAKLLHKEIETLRKLKKQLPSGTAHIVALLDFQLTDMPYWLAFEYVSGGTLESRMRLGAMDWRTTWQFFKPIVEGMALVHDLGIVHRDIKPANILLDNKLQPRIADFGIGKILAERDAAISQSRRNSTVAGYGSFGYMSPEQQDGEAAHPSDDVYALGVLLWQMLVGRLRPLRYEDEVKTLVIPQSVQIALATCVFKPRGVRPANARELLAALTQEDQAQHQAQVQKLAAEQQRIAEQERKNREAEKLRIAAEQERKNREAEAQRVAVPPKVKPKVIQPKKELDPLLRFVSVVAIFLIPWLILQVIRQPSEPENVAIEPENVAIEPENVAIEPEMVVIPAGSFEMGSPSNEEGRSDDEGPVHTVHVKAFQMGKYEITQGEWQAVMGNNPSYFSSCGERCPVEQVSWNEVQEYISKLNAKTGKNYRLPTEAEWEYACRAGTITEYSFGDDANKLGEYAWFSSNSDRKTHPVGTKQPNPWGLYDMHGNVWEWCQDKWHDSYAGAPTDDSAWETEDSNLLRVLRGGSWVNFPRNLRSANRLRDTDEYRDLSFGVRLVRVF